MQVSENVYLIFSANKSGEYFGYARMASKIADEATSNVHAPARSVVVSQTPFGPPVTIQTMSTATAPKGRIIDDSARGTIFWEAEPDPNDVVEQDEDNDQSTDAEIEAQPQSFGKPFKIVWMSAERLPFYKTRGLRNPWNANREVKIARDGTELEPSVGKRLVEMFHRSQGQPPSPLIVRSPTQFAGGTGSMSMGYPQGR